MQTFERATEIARGIAKDTGRAYVYRLQDGGYFATSMSSSRINAELVSIVDSEVS